MDPEISKMQQRIDELERRINYLYDKMKFAYSSEIKPSIFDPRLQAAIQSGNKIEAIKVYRELTNCDLLEAKTAVEDMWGNYRV